MYSRVMHDAVLAQYELLLFHGGVPIVLLAPMKSFLFLRLRNLTFKQRLCRDWEHSAAWYVACGTPFSDKPSLVIIGHLGVPYASTIRRVLVVID